MSIHALNHPTTRKKTRVSPSQIAQKQRNPGTLVSGVPVQRANGGPQEVKL